MAFLTSAAQADNIYVDDDNCPGPGSGTQGDPYCSIQTAIDSAVDTDAAVVANTIIDGNADGARHRGRCAGCAGAVHGQCAGTARDGGAPRKRASETLGLLATSHDREEEVLDESGRGPNVAVANGEATWGSTEIVAGGVTLSMGDVSCDREC